MFFKTLTVKNKTNIQTNNEYSLDVFVLAASHETVDYKKPIPAYIDFKSMVLGMRYDIQYFHSDYIYYMDDIYNLATLDKVEPLTSINSKIILPNLSKKLRNKEGFSKYMIRKMANSKIGKKHSLVQLTFKSGLILILAINNGLVPLLTKIPVSSQISDTSWEYIRPLSHNRVYGEIAHSKAIAFYKAKSSALPIVTSICCFVFFMTMLILTVMAGQIHDILLKNPYFTIGGVIALLALFITCFWLSFMAFASYLIPKRRLHVIKSVH